MQFSTYPISLVMLNQRLELCQSLLDLKDNFGFLKNENTEITFTVFIQSIEFLILSYKDLNFSTWGAFSKKVLEVFPTEQNNKALKVLVGKVT